MEQDDHLNNDQALVVTEEGGEFDLTQRSDAGDASQPSTPAKRYRESGSAPSSPAPKKRRSRANPYQMKRKIRDNVHGDIELSALCFDLIDTPEFQRMREVHQLGACRYVYPSATHSRFEHLLGVAHLVRKLILSLKRTQKALLKCVTEEDILTVQVAGLCHDLGHGPFSHTFENVFLPKCREEEGGEEEYEWHHEQMSVDMLRFIIQRHNIDLAKYFTDPEMSLLRIEDCILGRKPAERKSTWGGGEGVGEGVKVFLYDIVNNGRSGFDVDKLDYFKRDNMMAGLDVSMGWDLDRCFSEARVHKGVALDGWDAAGTKEVWQICFPLRRAAAAMDMFRTRFRLHQLLYQHPAVKAIELMICDVLLAVREERLVAATLGGERGRFRMADAVRHPEVFTWLRDSLLEAIMLAPEETEGLLRARALLDRLARRELYQCVGTFTIPSRFERQPHLGTLIKEGMLRLAGVEPPAPGPAEGPGVEEEGGATDREGLNGSEGGSPPPGRVQVGEEDLAVEIITLHHGKGSSNPVAPMRFYCPKERRGMGTKGDYKLVAKQADESSYECTIPRRFEDRKAWVFCKRPEARKALKELFNKWVKREDVSHTLQMSGSPPEEEESQGGGDTEEDQRGEGEGEQGEEEGGDEGESRTEQGVDL